MPAEGQNLREHIMEKYGSTAAQSDANRVQMQKLGKDLGIDFNFTDDSRIVNTFAAHQLLGWAQEKGQQHPLKMALFEAHFTEGRDVSDVDVLADVAASIGLDREEAATLLSSQEKAEETRAHEAFWTGRGISGVPAMIFDGKYLLTGAQGADTYAQMLSKVISEKDAA
jgi:predicted DsbA family dithiol-disulfide isomerase